MRGGRRRCIRGGPAGNEERRAQLAKERGGGRRPSRLMRANDSLRVRYSNSCQDGFAQPTSRLATVRERRPARERPYGSSRTGTRCRSRPEAAPAGSQRNGTLGGCAEKISASTTAVGWTYTVAPADEMRKAASPLGHVRAEPAPVGCRREAAVARRNRLRA